MAAGWRPAELDAPAQVLAEIRRRVQRCDADRVVQVARLDHEDAADQPLTRRERTVGDGRLAVTRLDRDAVPPRLSTATT